MSLNPNNHKISCALIYKELKRTKEQLVLHIESGDRDFEKLMILVNQYIDLQYTADVLTGQTKA